MNQKFVDLLIEARIDAQEVMLKISPHFGKNL